MADSCVSCRFFRKDEMPEGHLGWYGECRRHAPRPRTVWTGEFHVNCGPGDDEMPWPHWPRVSDTHNDWCGEFVKAPVSDKGEGE